MDANAAIAAIEAIQEYIANQREEIARLREKNEVMKRENVELKKQLQVYQEKILDLTTRCEDEDDSEKTVDDESRISEQSTQFDEPRSSAVDGEDDDDTSANDSYEEIQSTTESELIDCDLPRRTKSAKRKRILK